MRGKGLGFYFTGVQLSLLSSMGSPALPGLTPGSAGMTHAREAASRSVDKGIAAERQRPAQFCWHTCCWVVQFSGHWLAELVSAPEAVIRAPGGVQFCWHVI